MDEHENTGKLRKVFSGEIDLSSENKKSTLTVDEEDILHMADAIRQNRIEDQMFAINLDRFLDNDTRSSEYIYVCKTSNALAISGADKELDVVIAPRTIAKCMADPEIKYHGHGLTKNILHRIPEELRNPVMIFKGNKDNSIVTITRLKDNKSRGVMVAISLNETGKRNEVNRISSIYGRNNFINYLKAQLQNENLIAANKKEAKIMLQSAGLQLPLEETYLNFNDSIAYTMQNVKGYKEKINEGRKNIMKRFFIETNGYNMVAFVDDKEKAFVLHEQSFDKALTLETAKNADYSNLDGCKTAEECVWAMGLDEDRIIDFKELMSCAESYTEFIKDGTAHETYIKDDLLGWIKKETTESDQPDIAENKSVHNGRK